MCVRVGNVRRCCCGRGPELQWVRISFHSSYFLTIRVGHIRILSGSFAPYVDFLMKENFTGPGVRRLENYKLTRKQGSRFHCCLVNFPGLGSILPQCGRYSFSVSPSDLGYLGLNLHKVRQFTKPWNFEYVVVPFSFFRLSWEAASLHHHCGGGGSVHKLEDCKRGTPLLDEKAVQCYAASAAI